MDRFYIVHPYQNKNLMDVMYGQEKIAEGAEDTKIIEFETIDFVNEIANRLVVTEGIIRDASAWCREQGYNTYSVYDGGWKDAVKNESK